MMTGEFIPATEVGEMTGLTIQALAQLRFTGKGPRFYKPTARTVLYKRSEVIEWIEASARTITRSYA